MWVEPWSLWISRRNTREQILSFHADSVTPTCLEAFLLEVPASAARLSVCNYNKIKAHPPLVGWLDTEGQTWSVVICNILSVNLKLSLRHTPGHVLLNTSATARSRAEQQTHAGEADVDLWHDSAPRSVWEKRFDPAHWEEIQLGHRDKGD